MSGSELVGKIDVLIQLIEFLRTGGDLHYRYAYRLIKQVTEIYLQPAPNMVHATVPNKGRLTVGQWFCIKSNFQY